MTSRFSTIPLVLFPVDYEKKQEVFFMSIATEIVTMKTSQEVTKDSFISIVDSLEKNYHSKQQGFIDTELLYNEENREWTMVQHWASMEELKAASDKMFQDEGAAPFVKALDAASVKMSILPQIKIWG